MDAPVKSPNDKREYKVIKLGNRLTALLISDQHFICDGKKDQYSNISVPAAFCDNALSSEGESSDASDPETSEAEMEANEEMGDPSPERNKMAAAALCVKVGSFSDPDDLQGLAHFLEHMIFMGNKKYPKENYFDSFIYKHGGSTNAFTDCETTVFHLEVRPRYFHAALDIFASCFESPLLKRESMEREIKAVESEFQLRAPIDSTRKTILFGSLAKGNHPMSKFFWGNIKSLEEIPASKNIDIHQHVWEFWKQYYSAHFMTLAVTSTVIVSDQLHQIIIFHANLESLDVLENWVQETFSRIPNNGLTQPSFKHLVDPFKTEKFHKLYKVIPVKKTHQVVISWALPTLEKHYRVKPLSYLGWLVGHEGGGSILAFLRRKSLALSLYAGNDGSDFEFNSTCSLFSICIVLTEKGMDCVFEVICLVFQYIKMLQKEGPQERIYQEIKDIEDNVFRFQEPIDESDYVEQLAAGMHFYPPEHYLVGGKLFFDYDEQLIKTCQDSFTVDDANVIILSTRFSRETCCEVEPWTNASYSCSDIPKEWIQHLKDLDLHPKFALPQVNHFIATKFVLKNEVMSENQYPVKILEDESFRVWYKKDMKFKVPKAYIFCHLICPVSRKSAKNASMMDLFLYILNQELSELVYPAEVAGLSYGVYGSESGLVLQASGFDHKLSLLFETLIDHIVNFKLSHEMFPMMKIHLLRSYYNTFINPGKLCKDIRLSLSLKTYWSTVDKKLALKDVTSAMFMEFKKECFSKFFAELLVQGNITTEEALSLSSLVKSKMKPIPLMAGEFLELQAMRVPEGETYCRIPTFNSKDQNSAINNYYQSGPGTILTTSLMDLMLAHMSEPCFNVLRTQKQLGYDVSSSSRNALGIIGFMISVKSSSDIFSCSKIDEDIEEFLQEFSTTMEKLKDDDFKMQLASLIDLKRCEDLSLQEEVSRNWSEVLSYNYVFDRLQKEVVCLQNVTLDVFKSFVREQIATDKDKRKKLGVQVDGSQNKVSKDNSYPANNSGQNVNINDDDHDDNEDEKRIYTLSLITPQENANVQNFIKDINEYKANNTSYPMWTISS